jgi:alpha-amylase
VPPRFVFALHNHQPVGNFGGVFEGAYQDSYWPFLDMLEQYPEIPISLHTSGCLMEWLVEHKPEYVNRLRRLVARGQVEIVGGGFYEPILPMIPRRDRVGQIRTYTAYLEDLFQTHIRGMWVPERVWEQSLVNDIVDAGIEYTVLDDFHFKQAGLEEDRLFGYYLSEDNGKVLRIFPGSERMRYLVPFRNPEESLAYFGEVASRNPEAVIVFADDGEKFGSWPETHKHCYQDGWLRRFLDTLRHASSWVKLCTFAQALDETPPAGKIYLPDSSYREMTEWALPAAKLNAYNQLVHDLEHDPRWPEIQRFLRGGFWRNFRVKYPEVDEMYNRMLQVSRRLEEAEEANPSVQDQARQELYRAQCNCPWWHGAFGGLYLPHLRNAVYHHLIAADNTLLEAENRGRGWTDAHVADLNLDGVPEVCLSNSRLAAYFNPQQGGSLYELDLRVIRHNLLATLSRRPEAYHQTILRHAQGSGKGGAQSIHDRVVFKQAGLDRLLQYDLYLRKSLIDHFYDPRVSLNDLAPGTPGSEDQPPTEDSSDSDSVAESQDPRPAEEIQRPVLEKVELGDFLTGRYEQRVRRNGQDVQLIMGRAGKVGPTPVRLTKEITLRPGADALHVRYVLENLPRHTRFLFAVEFNFAGMAASADDRYFYYNGRQRAGQLQTLQDLPGTDHLGLVDEWLGLDASLTVSRRGGFWAFPIQTVSQSEGGFELVHQSTAVLPHWTVEADHQGRWEVQIDMRLDVSPAEKRMLASLSA